MTQGTGIKFSLLTKKADGTQTAEKITILVMKGATDAQHQSAHDICRLLLDNFTMLGLVAPNDPNKWMAAAQAFTEPVT